MNKEKTTVTLPLTEYEYLTAVESTRTHMVLIETKDFFQIPDSYYHPSISRKRFILTTVDGVVIALTNKIKEKNNEITSLKHTIECLRTEYEMLKHKINKPSLWQKILSKFKQPTANQ